VSDAFVSDARVSDAFVSDARVSDARVSDAFQRGNGVGKSKARRGANRHWRFSAFDWGLAVVRDRHTETERERDLDFAGRVRRRIFYQAP